MFESNDDDVNMLYIYLSMRTVMLLYFCTLKITSRESILFYCFVVATITCFRSRIAYIEQFHSQGNYFLYTHDF